MISESSESSDPLVTEIYESAGVISEYLLRYRTMKAKYDRIRLNKGAIPSRMDGS